MISPLSSIDIDGIVVARVAVARRRSSAHGAGEQDLTGCQHVGDARQRPGISVRMNGTAVSGQTMMVGRGLPVAGGVELES